MINQRITRETSGLTPDAWRILKDLKTPARIQDYLNSLQFNFEEDGEKNRSVAQTLKDGKAQCFEGALVAAAALWVQGRKPWLFDLKAFYPDYDHVVALFNENGKWGAISKTNHAALRYREPLYRDLPELAMSYFHEYFLPSGQKTLHAFSFEPFDLSLRGTKWLSGRSNLAALSYELDRAPHVKIITKREALKLRPADPVELSAGLAEEYRSKGRL